MTGIDVPISQLRQTFEDNLWLKKADGLTDSNTSYYGKTYRNLDKNGNVIAELFDYTDRDYNEVHFDDRLDAMCFFDVGNQRVELDALSQSKAEIFIIFVCNPEILQGRGVRDTEQLHKDVLDLIFEHHLLYISPTVIDTGLEAYGDLFTTNLKHYSMQPWYTFRVTVSAFIDYSCKLN